MRYTSNKEVLKIIDNANKNSENLEVISSHKPKTKVQIEHFLGDTMKVVGVQIDDLFEVDRIQKTHIKALIRARLRTPESRVPDNSLRNRPKPSVQFMKDYHGGKAYTLTKSKRELNTRDRLKVIYQCFWQVLYMDGLSKKEFLSLCDAYIDEHFKS